MNRFLSSSRYVPDFLRPWIICLTLISAPIDQLQADELLTLNDYEFALKTNNTQQIRILRAYLLGAVETHFMYSKMLTNWTTFNALCAGEHKPKMSELGALFEMKVRQLRRRYGDDIMGMPIIDVVPMIIEEQYRCF